MKLQNLSSLNVYYKSKINNVNYLTLLNTLDNS